MYRKKNHIVGMEYENLIGELKKILPIFFYFRLMVYVLVLFGGPFSPHSPTAVAHTHSTALCFFCLDDLAKFSHIWQILLYYNTKYKLLPAVFEGKIFAELI